MEKVEVGRKYKHFKGHEIEVLGIAKHSETLENMVIYTHLGTGDMWGRPSENLENIAKTDILNNFLLIVF